MKKNELVKLVPAKFSSESFRGASEYCRGKSLSAQDRGNQIKFRVLQSTGTQRLNF